MPLLPPLFVVESVRKGGKTIVTQPRPLAEAQRRFDAFKKLNGSSDTVAATLYRQYRGGSRRMIEAWASPDMPVRRREPLFMKPAAEHSATYPHPSTIPWRHCTDAERTASLRSSVPWTKDYELTPGHIYRRQDASMAIAELFRIAAHKNMRMVGMRLVKQILREYGDGAAQIPELLPKHFEPVTKKAIEASLELLGKASSVVGEAAAVAQVGVSPVRSDPDTLRRHADLLSQKDAPHFNPVAAARLRAAATEGQNKFSVHAFRGQEVADDGTRPIFALYFRLKALADCLSSNPSLVKLATDARATNSMDEFDRKAHRAAREMANLMCSSARFKIRRQLERDGDKRTNLTAAMETVRDNLDKIGGLTRVIDFGVSQRIKAGLLAREALAVWVQAMSSLPYKKSSPAYRPTWMDL